MVAVLSLHPYLWRGGIPISPHLVQHLLFIVSLSSFFLAALGHSCGRRDVCGLTWALPSQCRNSPVMATGSAAGTQAVLLRGVWEGP